MNVKELICLEVGKLNCQHSKCFEAFIVAHIAFSIVTAWGSITVSSEGYDGGFGANKIIKGRGRET